MKITAEIMRKAAELLEFRREHYVCLAVEEILADIDGISYSEAMDIFKEELQPLLIRDGYRTDGAWLDESVPSTTFRNDRIQWCRKIALELEGKEMNELVHRQWAEADYNERNLYDR